MNPLDREAARQQVLLDALLGNPRGSELGEVEVWLSEPAAAGPRIDSGLAVYRSNARALADRALSAAFPTLRELVGEESFRALAIDFWQRQPPHGGDIAAWGGGLAAFIAAAPSLTDEPYLADVARVDWAVHVAERAADACAVHGLELLASVDPSQLRLQLVSGTALVVSAHPVVAIWQAHRDRPAGTGDRFAPVRAAFAAGRPETALVCRQGWAPRVLSVTAAEARFTAALLAGEALGPALLQAGDGFDFQAWLIAALQQQRLLAVTVIDAVEDMR